MSKLEGNGASRIIQLIQKHGFNKDVDVELGTVISAPPAVKIRLDGDNFELDKDDVVIAGYLTKHSRKAKINGGAEQTLEFTDELKTGDRVIVLTAKDGQQYFVIDKAVTY